MTLRNWFTRKSPPVVPIHYGSNPERVYAFGTIHPERTSWLEVFDTFEDLNVFLKSHPKYELYSSWVSSV